MNQIYKQGSHYGILYGIAAYGSWGIIPLYFKTVAGVRPVECVIQPLCKSAAACPMGKSAAAGA